MKLTVNTYEVLERAWRGGFTTKSDFARSHATHVAALASQGLISTQVAPTIFCQEWNITSRGLEELENYMDIVNEAW